jgi:hypothetical protein
VWHTPDLVGNSHAIMTRDGRRMQWAGGDERR